MAHRSHRLTDPERSLLLVVDMQESYRGKLHEEERTVRASSTLIKAANILHIPVVVTEQYPEKLGPTRSEIEEVLEDDTPRFAKRTFSCWGQADLRTHIAGTGCDQVIVTGIETHVCVGQTVLDLMRADLQVHVPRDALTSRFALEDAAGWEKLVASGALPASAESILFEWVIDSREAEFKAIHALVA